MLAALARLSCWLESKFWQCVVHQYAHVHAHVLKLMKQKPSTWLKKRQDVKTNHLILGNRSHWGISCLLSTLLPNCIYFVCTVRQCWLFHLTWPLFSYKLCITYRRLQIGRDGLRYVLTCTRIQAVQAWRRWTLDFQFYQASPDKMWFTSLFKF